MDVLKITKIGVKLMIHKLWIMDHGFRKLAIIKVVAGICRIPLDVQYLDLIEKAEQKEEWFLKINPKHQIPVLSIDENTHLTESVVISQYLCRGAGHWGRAIYPSEFEWPT